MSESSNKIDNLINNIKKMSHSTFKQINKCDEVVKLGNLKLKFIGKGGEGIIYGIDKYAIKIYKTNTSDYTHKYTNQGGSKEIFILKESSKLVDLKVTNTFLKVYGFTEVFGKTVVIMDLVDGDLESWTEKEHTDHDWLSMIFQMLYATFIMQICLKIYHHDMKPKNMLFKKCDGGMNTYKYIIKTNGTQHEFILSTRDFFLITDFGQASTLLSNKNVFLPETIQISIDNNLDLEHLAVFHNRQAVTMLKDAYTLKDLVDMGKNDPHFMSYHDKHKNKINKNMKGYSESVKDSMLFRALGYYIIEKKYIDISDIPNVKHELYLPSKKIQKVLESLSELKGKGTLLNKIIEIGNIINSNNMQKIDNTFCVTV
jgi:serine/threonine protein kinase